MKKRTKITPRTKIYLTIVALLTLTGVLYGATFFTPALGPFQQGPIGVAASQTDMFVSDYCIPLGGDHRNIQKVNCQGVPSVVTSIPSFVGSTCEEMYMSMAPSQSVNAGFTPRDVFITNGPLIYRFTPPNPPNPLTAADIFAVIPSADCAGDHTGITFDHVGTFGNDMIVTCKLGNHSVWRVNGAGTPTHIADVIGGDEIEGPAVVPATFGPLGGQIWVTDEGFPVGGIPGAVHAISNTGVVTLGVLGHNGAEGINVIPTAPCTFCNTPGGTLFQMITQNNFGFGPGIYQYVPGDFVGLGGDVLVTSENGIGSIRVHFNGTNYVKSFFDNIPGGLYEGSNFVDCDVPTPTPTTTPTATATATATSTPTATATATSTPTATATATATATSTPTPTPTPTPQGHISQITPTGTTCAQFRDGIAATLDHLNYTVGNDGKIRNNVTPGVFFYWVSVTVPGGNNSITITQTITTGNFTCLFDFTSGSNVFDSNCNSVSETITQNPTTGAVTVQWNAPAGTYIIGIKYDSKSIAGCNAPGPATTVHYDFATTGVPGSTQGLDLIKR